METGRERDHTATSQDRPEPLLDEAGRDPPPPPKSLWREPGHVTPGFQNSGLQTEREHIPIVFSSQA